MTSDMDDSKTANASATNPTLSDNLAAKTWQLDALSEALGDLTLPITDSLSVGRGSDNDLVLGSKEVSRNHALLSVAEDQLYIKDLDSSNGTFINDERIDGNQSRALKSADIVGFASFSFQVFAVADTAKQLPVTGTDSIDSMNTADISPVNNDTLDNPTTNNITNDNTTAVDTHHNNAVSSDTSFDASPDANTTAEAISLATGAAATKSTISTGYKSKASDGTININDAADINSTASTTDTTLSSKKLPSSNEPVVKQTMVTEVLAASDSAQPISNSVAPTDHKAQTDEPIVKDTIVTEVLAAADSTDINSADANSTNITNMNSTDAPISRDSSALDETSAPTPTANAPTYEETVMSTEPAKDTAHNTNTDSTTTDEHSTKRAPYHDDTVAPEHDKTTTTELQEEADPEVLRAKQAATAQFSGTANLGGSRDLGTTGNNAMDQAIDNPANAASTDKKPSGGWFIWVFIIILIIGIALWLFNMGGV
ncbi:FHA domain-containing protein [Psychrobacter sp. T6-1]|uniref:FHA domain-containing protein n=1 Tax=Psychrobacter sp. T6-1 TaxID=3457447 RepID=UPI003FD06254